MNWNICPTTFLSAAGIFHATRASFRVEDVLMRAHVAKELHHSFCHIAARILISFDAHRPSGTVTFDPICLS